MNSVRLWVVVAVLVLGIGVVFGRSVQVMVLDHDHWQQVARRQQQRIITVPGQRGEIRSADGYVLATSLERVAIQVDTGLLSLGELFARAAAPLLDLDELLLLERLEHGPRVVWLAQRVEREVGRAVRDLAPAAVVLVPDSQRVYPLGRLAAPVVGFVGREEMRTVGRAGFEHHFDALLAGEPERHMAVRDAVQRQIRLQRINPGRAGYDLELSLNARLQAVCEQALQGALDQVGGRSASAVVLEASTGTVLALASLPSFDPAAPGLSSPEHWRLAPVQDALEPGSTVKPVVAAAAVAAGVVAEGEVFDCTHRGVTVAGRWVRDHAEPGFYSFDEVISESANVAIIEIAERLDPELLWRTFDAFGFGHRTEVGFPAEARGILPPLSSWSKMSCSGLALGQELTVSPLQMAVAYAIFANGGWLVRPHLVNGASDHGEVVSRPSQDRRQVLDSLLAERVSEMLEKVVREGTGTAAQVPGYRVAGKTGTAQRAVVGGFDDEHHVAWFAGFLPMPEPRFVVVVAVDQPQTDFWASSVAAPVFAEIAGAAVRLMHVPPTERLTADPPSAGGEA